jgi:threonine dehydrogenase-like Zn-dependent dehydrogenase
MDTIALRLYGKNDLRLERFDLPGLKDDEILADIASNSICMSTYKALIQGADHKRVPEDVHENPVIVGHELCGTILEVGKGVDSQFKAGMKYGIQPALNVPGKEMEAPGYSCAYIGGHATKIIIPKEVMERGCLLPYEGDGFFKASLSEPVSCIIGAFHTSYHFKHSEYRHTMGIVEGGTCAILAGAGPMGLGAIDYTLHGPRQPRLLVVTDVDQSRLDRAAGIYSPEAAKDAGVDLRFENTGAGNTVADLMALTDGKGFDDIFIFAPVEVLVEQASKILGEGGCLNFFAGPSNSDFSARVNFYDVHYSDHHMVGSSGGNTDDLREALDLMGQDRINPAVMITHIGGIDSAAEAIENLFFNDTATTEIYTQKSLPLTALEDFEDLGKTDSFFGELARLVDRSDGLWSVEAEKYLLEKAPKIQL